MQFKKFLGIMLTLCLLISCVAMIASCDNGSEEVKPSNKETAKPTEIQTDDPTEDNTDKPSEDNTDKPSEDNTDKPSEDNTEKPSEDNTEKPDDDKVDYTVTVVDEEGNVVSGVMIQVCIKNSTCLTPVVTDANGVATFSIEKRDDYQAKIFRAEGYEYDENYVDFGTSTSVEITVSAKNDDPVDEKVDYTVTVKDDKGNAVADVMIQVCIKNSTCLTPKTTDANGVVTFSLEEREDYQAKIFRAPEGYEYSEDYVDFGANTAIELNVEAVCTHVEETIEAVAPTCTETGLTAGVKCSVCGEILTAQNVVEALGHNYDSVITEPTCTEAGYTTYTCSACGDTYTADEIVALGHNYETVVTAPTCTEAGYTTYTCSVCGDTYTGDETAANGHNYETVVTVPTCTEAGYTTYTCSVCGDTYTADETAASGHQYTADCDADCDVCGEVRDAADHTYGNGCDADCDACGAVRDVNHVYDGDCDADCNVCGATRTAGDHTYDNGFDATCNICGTTRDYPGLVASQFDNFSIGYVENAFEGFTDTSVKNVSVDGINAATGELVISNMYAGMQIGMSGFTGYDDTSAKIEQFAYYFDNDFENRVNSDAGRASTAQKNVAGRRAATFAIDISTTGLSVGQHTLTFVVELDDGRMMLLATWNVTIKPIDLDMSKPMANVIIISGQSNAYGASPITDAVRAQYQDKVYNNVYMHYNNINVMTHPVDNTQADQNGTWQTIFSNDGFEQFALGVGGQGNAYIGPELGIVDYLCTNGYADETPLFIIKFTAAGTYLNGQWFPTDQANTAIATITNNFDPFGLVSDMGDYLYNQMADYIQDSLDMIAENYTPQIRSFFWVQGESDAGVDTVARSYEAFEQRLVNSVRSDFVQYTSDTGISFVNYSIAETQEGDINWIWSSIINKGKEANCEYYFDPAGGMTEPGFPKTANLSNSVLVISDTLRSKATAGDYESNGVLSTDYAHLCGEDMALLGQWMGQGMLYLEEVMRSGDAE
ncbi:MAG: hypothetical protein E7667_00825 [Ruminococcaceae bacterium]|nr:hypothetical protein [Oscillospiraceae bacterium]